MDPKPVITRMPPSPTGHLHIGTARTALFNFLFSRHHGGKMIFRSEDTDTARSKREYEAEIIDGLHWLGIEWDNQDIYRQSERGAIYKTYLEKLIANGTAYISAEESTREPGTTVEVVRLKNPNKQITFTDLIRGDITFDTTELGDIVIARSIDDALYHFTVVVDDHEMGVTHVLRGEDHVSNTPRQILIQEAIGAARPQYGHLPLILAPDRSKMSKRHGAVSLNEYREQGYLKDAIVNYLALLGWNPGTDQEIFTLDELIAQFSITKVQKGGAVFDIDKFRWINRQHLSKLSEEEFSACANAALPEDVKTLPQYSAERAKRLLPVIRERAHIAADITSEAQAGEYDFAFSAPTPDPELIKWKKDPSPAEAAARLQHVQTLLAEADFSTPDTIKAAVWDYAEEVGRGEVLWPLRTTLSGRERSPDPFTCAFIIGKEETLRRIQNTCDKITG